MTSFFSERKAAGDKLKTLDKQLQKITTDKVKNDKERKEALEKCEQMEKELVTSKQEKGKLKNQVSALEKKLIELNKEMREVIKEAQNIPIYQKTIQKIQDNNVSLKDKVQE